MGALKATLLSAVRRGREVGWAEPWMRFGNQMMLGVWAYEGRQEGRTRYVLRQPGQNLVNAFPVLAREYMITRDRIRPTDQRIKPWLGRRSDRWQSWPAVDGFIRDLLLPESGLDGPIDRRIVLNVRRGDYYSVPENRAEFGINITGYVQAALEIAGPGDIHVVSDDVAWCHAHLGEMLSARRCVTYGRGGDPLGDLAALIHAETLIVPNSTFSMWGGYIGDLVHPGRRVIAPWLFSRYLNGGECEAYRPEWTVVEDIPGGWDVISD